MSRSANALERSMGFLFQFGRSSVSLYQLVKIDALRPGREVNSCIKESIIDLQRVMVSHNRLMDPEPALEQLRHH